MKKNLKNTLSCLLLIATVVIFSACKKTTNSLDEFNQTKAKIASTSSKTIKDVIFAQSPDYAAKISQLNTQKDKQRMLIPIKSGRDLKLFKYLLVEENATDKKQIVGNLVSKTKITDKTDLFLLPLATDGNINYYDVSLKKNARVKLQLKYNGKEIGVNEKASSTFIENSPSPDNPINQQGYCIDHYWVVYDVETGEIISIEYTGTDCYGCMETGTCEPGGGGGSGGPFDSTALYNAMQAEYLDIQEDIDHCTDHKPSLITRFNSETVATNPFNWTVAIIGSKYRVEASSQTEGNTVPGTHQQKINVNNIKTNSATFVKLSWYLFYTLKWENPVMPDGYINNNGTASPLGHLEVSGNIHIDARMPGASWAILTPDRGVLNYCEVIYKTGSWIFMDKTMQLYENTKSL